MPIKEMAAGAVIVGSAGAGGGYVAYRFINTSEGGEEEESSTEASVSAVTPASNTIGEQLINIASNGWRRPIITLTSDKASWLSKASHRYFLEIKDEITNIGSKNDRDSVCSDKS